jgi:hypothetical protein
VCSENSQIMYSDPSILTKIPKNDHFFRPLPWDFDFEIVEFCDLNIIIFRLNYDKKVNFVNFFSKKSAFFAFFGKKMTIFSKQIQFLDNDKHFCINFCWLCFWIENPFHKVVPKFFVSKCIKNSYLSSKFLNRECLFEIVFFFEKLYAWWKSKFRESTNKVFPCFWITFFS